MSKQTETNLFIVSSMPRLYQHLLKGLSSYQRLAETILSDIRIAYDFRRIERVRELSRILIHIPIKEYRAIGEYYLIWCECRESRFHTESLERIIGQTQTYKAQALLSRGTFEVYKGKPESALYFYLEGLKASHSVSDHIGLSLAIAQLKSIEGFHKSSLGDLENLIPIIRHAEPRLYYDFLNSYAVEIDKAGHKNEARNIIKRVIVSPFIHAYPAWRETARDLKQSSRSFVTVPLIERGPVMIEATKHASKPEPESDTQPASVLSFPKLKEAPRPEKPDQLTPQEYAQLTTGDKRELILAAVKSGAISEDDYYKMMSMLGLLTIGPADKILDLEDAEVLDNIAVIWSAQIGAEELAGFLSALRDCDDRIRQRDIIDRMIRIAFQETQLYGITEDQWRLDVERRLPEK